MPQIIVGAILIFVASYLVIALLTAAIFAAVVAALISAALYVGAISAFAISSAVANNRKHTYRFDISSDIPTILRVHQSGVVGLSSVLAGAIIAVSPAALAAAFIWIWLQNSKTSNPSSFMDVLNAASLYLGFFAGVFASIWFAFSKFANFKTALLLGFSSVSRDIDRAISAKIEALAESHGCLAKHWNALNIDAPVERWKFLTPFTEEPFTIDAETEIFALLDEQSVLHTRLTVHTLSAIEAINNHSIAIADAEKSLRGKEIALRELKKLDSLCTQQELFESIASMNTTGLADVAEAHRLRIDELKRAAFDLPNQSAHQTETRQANSRNGQQAAYGKSTRSSHATNTPNDLPSEAATNKESAGLNSRNLGNRKEFSALLEAMQKILLQTKRLELLVADHDDLLGLVRAVEIAVDIERGPNAQFLLQLAEEGQDQRIERFFGGALHEVGSIESKLRQRIAEEAAAKASKVNSKVINDPHFAWPDLAHIDNCFAIFGLTQSATAADVSREYKSQAKRFQTDCGGNLQEMQRINAARERIYDYLDAIGASTNFPLHSK